jgi:hypothetical protein
MSLPQRLYELYREVAACELVESRRATPENMLVFQDLLNKTWPVDEAETHQRTLVRAMYNSRQRGFVDYISVSKNRVGALILWTESKSIARYFGLSGVVHISWNEESHTYTVSTYVPRELRPEVTATDNNAESTEVKPDMPQKRARRNTYRNIRETKGVQRNGSQHRSNTSNTHMQSSRRTSQNSSRIYSRVVKRQDAHHTGPSSSQNNSVQISAPVQTITNPQPNSIENNGQSWSKIIKADQSWSDLA